MLWLLSLTNCACNRVSSKSGEVSSESVRDLLAAQHCTHRKTIAEALADSDNVGDEAEVLKSPHVVAGPAHATLDLVSNDQAAVLAHNSKHKMIHSFIQDRKGCKTNLNTCW